MRTYLRLFCGVSSIAASFAGASGANAQAAAASSTPPAASPTAADAGLQDIVITAQRRSESLQRAAIAVTAVPASTLVRAGVTDTTQLTRVTPALQISNVAGSANAFYLRGVGNFTTNALSDSAVSFNIDGVALARTQAAQAVFYDLARVEVLKGPQGTLYGRNATGGAINVITAKPVLGEFSGFGTAEYGKFDATQFTGALNAPLGEKAAVRVAGLISDRDGYYSDGTGDDKTRAARVQLTGDLAQGFRLTVGGDYAFQGGKGPGATINGLDRDKRIGLHDPRAGAIYASTFSFLAGNTLHPLDNDDFNHNKFWGLYAQAEVDTPVGTLTVLPAYRHMKLSQRNYAGSFAYLEDQTDKQTSVEVRLASNDAGRLSYLLGLYYLGENSDEFPTYGQQYFAAYATFLTNTKSYAGFGRLTYKLTDTLRLTGGIRYTIDKKSAFLDSVNAVVICNAVFVGGACPGTPALPATSAKPAFLFAPDGSIIPFQPYGPGGASLVTGRTTNSPSKTFRKPTYRAGIEYDLGSRSLLYMSFETGFKSGGFFSSIDNPVYQPETITAYTIGSKNRFLDNHLQVNLEAFHWTYKGQQVSHFRTNSQGGTEFVTENIGKSRIQGFEIETRAQILEGTTLNATVQYLDAKNKSFVFSNPAALGPPVSGCPISGPNAVGQFVVNCSGRRPINAPEWTAAAGIEQTIGLGSAGKLVFNADGRYQSSSYTGFEQLPNEIQKSYFMADLQITYSLPGDHLTLSGFANNVTNQNVVAFSQPHPRSPALVVENLRPPRTYGVRLSYKF
ncbi:MAG TPA: TonB-dependent receptor [Sphingomonas sp.]|nr:TonB-dependent receptor [Sphingomonas sp.]